MATPVTLVNVDGQEFWKTGSATATFTPAATSHTALDCVGGAKTILIPNSAGRMVAFQGNRFSMDTTTPVTSIWTLYMYNSTPAVIADDSPYVVVTADGAKFLGTQPILQCVDFGSTWLESQNFYTSPIRVQMVTDTLTVYLQNVSTITLEAVAHKLTLFYEIQA